ncbi:hypothetical protein SAMN02910289_00493 [Lachnospiraceae bacterium RM5]|nr:hypothetical protein SAMN02910289_00493 [Lachnospiraceae bacterium RM5]
MRCPNCGEEIEISDFVCPNCKMELPLLNPEEEPVDYSNKAISYTDNTKKKKKAGFSPRRPYFIIFVLLIALAVYGGQKGKKFIKRNDGMYVCTTNLSATNNFAGTQKLEMRVTATVLKCHFTFITKDREGNIVEDNFEKGDITFSLDDSECTIVYGNGEVECEYDHDAGTIAFDYKGDKLVFKKEK